MPEERYNQPFYIPVSERHRFCGVNQWGYLPPLEYPEHRPACAYNVYSTVAVFPNTPFQDKTLDDNTPTLYRTPKITPPYSPPIVPPRVPPKGAAHYEQDYY